MTEFDRVTTRGGDRGESSLYNGERRRKDDPLFEAMGDVDELSSQIGVARAQAPGSRFAGLLQGVQRTLIAVGAQIATPKADPLYEKIPMITDADVELLEAAEAELLAHTEIGGQFVLPGGTVLSAHLDVARSVCRRAERRVVGLIREAGLVQLAASQRYLNRLSDLLFILARNVEQGTTQDSTTPR
ncbi:MAG TPA: cob(I)yrinic acid a,c-diamide adenosyltransferase [Spirochaetia bacterium]|nr:cob(I)yrinic acid a,c-diamide adenosyltransferase [Spirochaetia bacterium]